MKTIIAVTKGLPGNYIRTIQIARAMLQKSDSEDYLRFTYPSYRTACMCISPTGRGVVVAGIHSQNEYLKQDTRLITNILPLYKSILIFSL